MELRYSFSIKINFAGGRGVNARDNSNQGRLARSVISYQTDQLSLIEINADIGKRLKVSIGKGNVLNANKRLPCVTDSVCSCHKIQSLSCLYGQRKFSGSFQPLCQEGIDSHHDKKSDPDKRNIPGRWSTKRNHLRANRS